MTHARRLPMSWICRVTRRSSQPGIYGVLVVQFGQHPSPRHVVAHLSDPHLLAEGRRQYGVIDTEAGLRLALERVARLDPPPDALAFTGDLADRGEPAAYTRLREVVGSVAGELGAEVVWVM